MMRTTLTLEEDIAAKVRAAMRASGKPLKATVNELLRLGLSAKQDRSRSRPFRVHARDLGRLKPGLSLDSVGDLIEQLEGPDSR